MQGSVIHTGVAARNVWDEQRRRRRSSAVLQVRTWYSMAQVAPLREYPSMVVVSTAIRSRSIYLGASHHYCSVVSVCSHFWTLSQPQPVSGWQVSYTVPSVNNSLRKEFSPPLKPACLRPQTERVRSTASGSAHRGTYLYKRWNRVSVSAHSAGAYTATLLVMVNVRSGRAPPTLTSPGQFYPHDWMYARKQTLLPYSVYSVALPVTVSDLNQVSLFIYHET